MATAAPSSPLPLPLPSSLPPSLMLLSPSSSSSSSSSSSPSLSLPLLVPALSTFSSPSPSLSLLSSSSLSTLPVGEKNYVHHHQWNHRFIDVLTCWSCKLKFYSLFYHCPECVAYICSPCFQHEKRNVETQGDKTKGDETQGVATQGVATQGDKTKNVETKGIDETKGIGAETKGIETKTIYIEPIEVDSSVQMEKQIQILNTRVCYLENIIQARLSKLEQSMTNIAINTEPSTDSSTDSSTCASILINGNQTRQLLYLKCSECLQYCKSQSDIYCVCTRGVCCKHCYDSVHDCECRACGDFF